MEIGRLRALIGPAIEDARTGATSAAFEELRERIDRLTEEPSGVGFLAPSWLEALEEEADAIRAEEVEEEELPELELNVPQKRLRLDQARRQIPRLGPSNVRRRVEGDVWEATPSPIAVAGKPAAIPYNRPFHRDENAAATSGPGERRPRDAGEGDYYWQWPRSPGRLRFTLRGRLWKPLTFEGAITEENRLAGTLPLGQLALTTEIENYPGYPAGNVAAYLDSAIEPRQRQMMAPTNPEGITGPELLELMRQQAKNFGTRVITQDIVDVDFDSRPFLD